MKAIDVPPNFGSVWQGNGPARYEGWYRHRASIHTEFIEWFQARRAGIKSVLEVGCGTGAYPILNRGLFDNMEYVGVDISASAIQHATEHSDFEFICDDFLTREWGRTFDLIFSHAVIDHIHNPNEFVLRIANMADKYAFITVYGGYRDNIKKHDSCYDEGAGCYGNKISAPEIRAVLGSVLDRDEFEVKPFLYEGAILIQKRRAAV